MESLEYIDSYFKGGVPPDQKRTFEERIQTDQDFAKDVAFYLAAIQAARSVNAEDKKERFRDMYFANKKEARARPVKKMWPYLAAVAAMLAAVIVGVYFYMQPQTPPQLAGEYMEDHFKTMGVQMGNNLREIQNGKRMYNEGKQQQALVTFENIIQKDSSDYEAREFAGITALQLKDYNKAIMYFTQMERNSQLHVNPGKFYHALTLMHRNQPQDNVQAKALLEEVVNEHLAGDQDAIEFLKHFN